MSAFELARCLAMLDEVSRGGESVVSNRRGVPVAQLGLPGADVTESEEWGASA